MCQTFSENQIDIINSCLNNVISLALKITVFRDAAHFGCAIREVRVLSYRQVAAPVGMLSDFPQLKTLYHVAHFCFYFFQVSLLIRKVDWLTYDYKVFNLIIAIAR